MTHTEAEAIRRLVKADELFRQARDLLCGAFIDLPIEHPAREKIELRWRSLFMDEAPVGSNRDGLFYDFIKLVSMLTK